MTDVILKTVNKKLKTLHPKEKSGKLNLLLAVSGGADSIAMLHSVFSCNKNSDYEVTVITINHNIRAEEETLGDAQFVCEFCKTLSIKCIVVELEKNEVYNLAKERKNGIEEAARFLRYKEFKRNADEINADYILTAHNKNDYYETILMRIFQGAEPDALSGIAEKRDMFFRPLLEISRMEIETYLNENGLKWREDSSNQEQTFLRNKIRHTLIPALNISFDTWQQGLDKSLEKIKLNSDFVNSTYQKKITEHGTWQEETNNHEFKLSCDFNFFSNLEDVLQLKFIQDGINILNSNSTKSSDESNAEPNNEKNTVRKRIPYSVFKDFLKISENNKTIYSGDFCLKYYQSENSSNERPRLFFFKEKHKEQKSKTIKSYAFWISSEENFPKTIASPAGKFFIEKTEVGFFVKHESDKSENGLGAFKTPFCIRSKVLGDEIILNTGKTKSLKKIISDWKLNDEERHALPIIEEKGVIKAIYGKIFEKHNILSKEK